MTASLGVKGARGGDDAVDFVLHKMANLDARRIQVVRENIEELREFTNDPVEGACNPKCFA